MIATVMKFVVVVVLLVSLLCAFSPIVEAREFAMIYRECGIGAMLAADIPWLAVILNVTWDLGTTAILSNATSPETCAGGDARTAAFIYDAYDSLEADLARGSGEYLDSLMVLSGCKTDVYQSLSLALREDLRTSVAIEGYTDQTRFQKAENLYNLFYKHVEGEFSGACSNPS
jgi:hypothetical protein